LRALEPIPRLVASATAWRRAWLVGLLVAVVAGVVFRLIWLEDMEYKADEAWTFSHVREFWRSLSVPMVGMPSSAAVPNAGLSVWVFVALGSLVPLETPLALARAVQVLNVLAIALLAGFAATRPPQAEREPWLWSVALVSVNPFAVLFSRKIWPPDVLPVFALAMLVGWWYRRRRWGAFAWGMVGAALGQIQLAGFLFAAAFVGCALLFDRRSVRWWAWLCGSILGALPMLPWLAALGEGGHDIAAITGLAAPLPAFLPDWIDMSLGVGLGYSLGADFEPFLAGPTVAGLYTYLAAALVGAIVVLALMIALRLVRALRADRARTLALLFDRRSATALALAAAFPGYGLLLMATLRPAALHYFVVAFCLPALSVAWCVRASSPDDERSVAAGRRLLLGLALAQACLTLCFLCFIHETQVIDGDYGTVYRAQMRPPD